MMLESVLKVNISVIRHMQSDQVALDLPGMREKRKGVERLASSLTFCFLRLTIIYRD